MDHCLACMDLGEAWAMFRMGDYDSADTLCTLVIESEDDPDGLHARRARDISSLAKGFLALRGRDYPVAWACFREIRDPQLRDLGKPYIERSHGWSIPSVANTGGPSVTEPALASHPWLPSVRGDLLARSAATPKPARSSIAPGVDRNALPLRRVAALARTSE